eukprot:830736-Rhodomonas_salina.5
MSGADISYVGGAAICLRARAQRSLVLTTCNIGRPSCASTRMPWETLPVCHGTASKSPVFAVSRRIGLERIGLILSEGEGRAVLLTQ